MVSSSLIRLRLNTISIFRPADGDSESRHIKYMTKRIMNCTMVMVIQTPCLNEVLSKFSIRHHFHLIWEELNISFVKFFNLQIHTAYLMCRISFIAYLIWDLGLCARSKEEPECQMGSSEAGRCSGTSCCGSGTY